MPGVPKRNLYNTIGVREAVTGDSTALQQLLDLIMPKESIMPMMGVMDAPGARSVYRGAGDLKKVLPQGSNVPPAPNTGQQVGGAFDDYLKRISDLLQRGGPRKP